MKSRDRLLISFSPKPSRGLLLLLAAESWGREGAQLVGVQGSLLLIVSVPCALAITCEVAIA
jgi:hypothetical protein